MTSAALPADIQMLKDLMWAFVVLHHQLSMNWTAYTWDILLVELLFIVISSYPFSKELSAASMVLTPPLIVSLW